MISVKLPAVLAFVLVAKSLAISYREFEGFKKFIKKSSQLTPPLKEGIDYDYDEDEDIPDQAWELSGKFEGDLILNDRQREMIIEDVAEGLTRNGLLNTTMKWPDNEVVYAILVDQFKSSRQGDLEKYGEKLCPAVRFLNDIFLANGQVQAILDAIEEIARKTCIKFRRYRKGDRAAVIIKGNDTGCYSQVGYQGYFQKLNLYNHHPVGRGCFRHGVILHELMHTLGFFHTQSSPDRDDYVDIIWENIKFPYIYNFKNYTTSYAPDFGVGYDFNSIMHYSKAAYSANGKDTIVPKKDDTEIEPRLQLSNKDSQKMNIMYCDAKVEKLESNEYLSEDTNKESNKKIIAETQDIGYDKGIAVIIKLLPTPDAYKLLDVSSHVFEYDKTPQIPLRTEHKACRDGKH